MGSWAGSTHLQTIPTSRVWSSNFIPTYSSPFSEPLQTPTNSGTKHQLSIHSCTHGPRYKHSAWPCHVNLLSKVYTHTELQKTWLNLQCIPQSAKKEKGGGSYQPQSNKIHHLYNNKIHARNSQQVLQLHTWCARSFQTDCTKWLPCMIQLCATTHCQVDFFHQKPFKELLILTKCFKKPAMVKAWVEHNLCNSTQKWAMLVEIMNIQVAHCRLI
jgi:hypothetical protein